MLIRVDGSPMKQSLLGNNNHPLPQFSDHGGLLSSANGAGTRGDCRLPTDIFVNIIQHQITDIDLSVFAYTDRMIPTILDISQGKSGL